MRFSLDGKDGTVWASGLRNAVGFAWQPGTGALYATDNGRDLLGDDFPPCELDRVVEGGFYGWPLANGNRVPDPDYGKGREREIAASIPPAFEFAAHTAPLGIAFYDASGPRAFPDAYRDAAFVALHGSWNRSRKIGYEVVVLFFHPDGRIEQQPFVTGFLVGEQVYGRPVDVAVGPDAALYVSDDFTGSIYRVAYGSGGGAGAGSPAARPAAVASPADPLAAMGAAERTGATERGERLWRAHDCARCHTAGASAEPGVVVRPLAGLARKYDVASLARFLEAPQPPMPAYPLAAEQRRDLAVYLLATHP
jgi:mono/diheme cytochrome c family protein